MSPDFESPLVASGPPAAELGRLGGRKTSIAKQRAAAANGHKGGRPPKIFTERRRQRKT